MSALTVGIYAHWRKPGASVSLRCLLATLEAEGIRAIVEEGPARLLAIEGQPLDALARESDVLIALGGDGTLLRLVRDLHGHLVRPIMGINFGTLGFLTSFSGPEFREAARALRERTYRVDERTLLVARLMRDGQVISEQTGLNDVVVTRGERSRLVQVEVHIEGALLTEYNADGLIVSTSTGSTAYSLSAGGPIVMPDSGVLVVTPICPHVLTNRSVVVSTRSTLTIRPSRGGVPLLLSVDGHEPEQILPDDCVRIAAADRKIPLLFPRQLTFADVLRSKLRWSGTNI
ncbi:MAG: NAD(+)/NADH kinase [Verrucomicrobia bacterium]|nr:NAD(+)/NADH kinase [Verrucomicrobiota bacterium]